MKIKIAYTEDEQQQAAALVDLIQKEMQCPGSTVTVNRSEAHKPFFHFYLASGKRKKST